jgi:hypothetical protein
MRFSIFQSEFLNASAIQKYLRNPVGLAPTEEGAHERQPVKDVKQLFWSKKITAPHPSRYLEAPVPPRTIFENFDATRATFASAWQIDIVVANMGLGLRFGHWSWGADNLDYWRTPWLWKAFRYACEWKLAAFLELDKAIYYFPLDFS